MKEQQIRRDLVEALAASKPKTSAYDTEAKVIRIENGTAWVHIPGGVDETPASMTINSREGDTVRVRVSGGKAWLVGNDTAPPTDDMTAIYATHVAEGAQKTADTAKEGAEAAWQYADIAKGAADAANTAAGQAREAADNALTNLSIVEDVAGTINWIQEHGSYTLTEDETVQRNTIYFQLINGDYVPIAQPDPDADPAEEGWYVLDVSDSQADYIMAHLAVTSAGLWVLPTTRMAEVPVADSDDDTIIDSDDDTIVVWAEDPQHADGYKVLLSSDGMTVYDGSGVAVAFYGDTMTIGKSSGNNVFIDSDSVDVRHGSTVMATFGTETVIYSADGTELAHFGYASGTSASGTEVAPYYSLGKRVFNENVPVGNYSVAEGDRVTAAGYASHAEGTQTQATGGASHAEGVMSEASASGSHAEGLYTEASASGAHAQNFRTVADQVNQTAIGKYNTANNIGNLFAVGNGSGSFNRSDAFTVDENGNAVVAGALTAGNIDAGLTSATVDTAAGTYQDVSIAFHKTFASAPIVVVGFDTTGSQANFGLCCVAVKNGSITTTGFTARVFNADSAVRKPRVSWIAIGV